VLGDDITGSLVSPLGQHVQVAACTRILWQAQVQGAGKNIEAVSPSWQSILEQWSRNFAGKET
jgi:hypothetical protein